MSNPAQDFRTALIVQRVASHKEASSAENRLKEVLRKSTWHEEYVRVRQEDLREVMGLPMSKAAHEEIKD